MDVNKTIFVYPTSYALVEKKRTDFIVVGPVLLNIPNLPVFLLCMFLEVALGVFHENIL